MSLRLAGIALGRLFRNALALQKRRKTVSRPLLIDFSLAFFSRVPFWRDDLELRPVHL